MALGSGSSGAAVAWTAGERQVVRRAGLRVGLLVGGAVTMLVTLVGSIAYGMLIAGQERQIRRELAYSASYGDPSGPPGCTWLFLASGGPQVAGVFPPPPGFPLRDAFDTVATTRSALLQEVERNGTVYFVLTQPRGDDVVQAVFDARYQLADRRYLLIALSITEAIGLLAAVGTAVIVGRVAVAPLAEALARQRRFIADASHELRTPITQIHTRAQVLARRARQANLPDDHRSDLDRLVRTTRRLGEVVDDLLLSARLRAAPATQPPENPVDLAALAETAVLAETDRASEQGVTLTLERPDTPVRVRGVQSALHRVISELLTNALRHTPTGGRIEVSVRHADAGDAVELTVADTGSGFEPSDRIFERFQRGSSAEGQRTGLGLALAREVITSHGGTIEATSHPGHGASFTVRLPAETVPSLLAAQPARPGRLLDRHPVQPTARPSTRAAAGTARGRTRWCRRR